MRELSAHIFIQPGPEALAHLVPGRSFIIALLGRPAPPLLVFLLERLLSIPLVEALFVGFGRTSRTEPLRFAGNGFARRRLDPLEQRFSARGIEIPKPVCAQLVRSDAV